MSSIVRAFRFFDQAPGARVDWFAVIAELERERISIAELAKRCVVSRGTISYWKAGGEPKHSDGQSLLILYAERFPGKAVPVVQNRCDAGAHQVAAPQLSIVPTSNAGAS
ncbi:MAG: hypothetical protein WC830_22140 [Burkholderiales bacterium]